MRRQSGRRCQYSPGKVIHRIEIRTQIAPPATHLPNHQTPIHSPTLRVGLPFCVVRSVDDLELMMRRHCKALLFSLCWVFFRVKPCENMATIGWNKNLL